MIRTTTVSWIRWSVMLALGILTAAQPGCKFPYPADVPDDDADFDAGDAVMDAVSDGPPGPTFARAYGSNGSDFGSFVAATDEAIVFGGLAGEGIDLGSGVSVGPFFAGLMSPAGQHRWSLAWPGQLLDAAFDRFGNFYIVGELDGAARAGGPGGPLLTSEQLDLFVAKYDSQGRHLWSRALGGAGAQVGQRIAIASDDDLVVCGEYAGATNFGGGPLTPRGDWDVFVTKLSRSDGAHRWSLGFGATSTDLCRGLVASADGRVAVFGGFTGNLTINGAPIAVGGGRDVFAVGLSPNGSVQWSQGLGGSGHDLVLNATYASQGDLLIVGSFEDDIVLGPRTLHSQAANDGFIARLSFAGQVLWATSVSGARLEDVKSVTAVGEHVLVSGVVDGPAMIGDVRLSPPAQNQTDIFVATLRYGDGVALAGTTYGGLGVDGVTADTVVAQGTVILTGQFLSQSMDFGVGVVTNTSDGSDAYLARVPLP